MMDGISDVLSPDLSEVILVGHVVAVPGDHVERRLAELADMKAAAPLHGEARRLLPVLEGGNRRQEVARVGEAVRADRAALRQGQRRRVVLAAEAPRGPFYRPGADLTPPRPPELGRASGRE